MTRLRTAFEIALLFAALLCLLPYIPSHEGFEYRFGFMQILAIAMFGFSRGLRWREKWHFTTAEVLAFAAFAWVLTACYDLIYTS